MENKFSQENIMIKYKALHTLIIIYILQYKILSIV